MVLTPESTKRLNELVEAGELDPYVYFAMSEQDWLSMGQFMQDNDAWIKQMVRIVDYYRKQ